MLLLIDAQTAGIAGDMLLSALVDLGADKKKVIDSLHRCKDVVDWFNLREVSFEYVKRCGFKASMLNVKYGNGSSKERKGIEIYDAISRCADHLGLSAKAKDFAISSVNEIIMAEARVHGEDYSNVHFHEISSIDTLVDILGTAVALDNLNIFKDDVKIYSSKVAIGGGYVEFSHGRVSNPAPAVLEIFKGKRFTLIGGSVEEELTTPTGAAMLVSLAECSIDFYPAFECLSLGYGAGSKSLDHLNLPNILRVILAKEHGMFVKDSIIMLETSIDDVDGEVVGDLIDTLLARNARDVNVISAIGKKGRPVYIVRALCTSEDIGSILDTLVKESGTLGVRVYESSRYIVPRSIIHVPMSIMGKDYTVRVKVAMGADGKIIHYKAEYDDVSNIARELNISYRLAASIINSIVHNKLIKGNE
jgi:uncharacterized protein (TIGR00299 family) protein